MSNLTSDALPECVTIEACLAALEAGEKPPKPWWVRIDNNQPFGIVRAMLEHLGLWCASVFRDSGGRTYAQWRVRHEKESAAPEFRGARLPAWLDEFAYRTRDIEMCEGFSLSRCLIIFRAVAKDHAADGVPTRPGPIDLFAACALGGMIAAGRGRSLDELTDDAYDAALAMHRERERRAAGAPPAPPPPPGNVPSWRGGGAPIEGGAA